jgi:hypothetical protein
MNCRKYHFLISLSFSTNSERYRTVGFVSHNRKRKLFFTAWLFAEPAKWQAYILGATVKQIGICLTVAPFHKTQKFFTAYPDEFVIWNSVISLLSY